MIEVKRCLRCKEIFPLEKFGKHKKSSDGLQDYCKPCYREYANQYQREYRKKNPGLATQRQREWRENNRERINQQAHEYIQNNPDKHHQKRFGMRLNHAIYSGKITKPNSCSICNSTKNIQAHHPDYEPGHELIVIWVCAQCHANIHKELKNGTI